MSRALILFGAGASYGSDSQMTPPLGSELFDALCGFSPHWGSIPQRTAASFRADFEQGMSQFADSHPNDLDPLQRAMAGFFFQFEPRPASLYMDLARRIQDANWDGAVATLNYERLLELALRAVDLHIAVGDTPKGGGIEVCFPHGCCNRFGQIRARENISFDTGIVFDSLDIRVIDNAKDHARELCTSSVPPVMSYFTPAKETRSGVSFINDQRQRFRVLVDSAPSVAIIGLRVRPHDTHIWCPLAHTGARIIYCGGPNGAEEYKKWAAKQRPPSHDSVLPGYFKDEFDTLCGQVGL